MSVVKPIAISLLGWLFSIIVYAQVASPVGYWKQMDDRTGQLHSILQISQSGDELKGKVVKGFSIDGQPLKVYCTGCPGQFNNQKIEGMTVLWGLIYDSANNEWVNGSILDPDNGRIYKASATLSQDGQQLSVRGFIGISLLGRSQTWDRLTSAQMTQLIREHTS